jgi:hypothetical protein
MPTLKCGLLLRGNSFIMLSGFTLCDKICASRNYGASNETDSSSSFLRAYRYYLKLNFLPQRGKRPE